MAVLRIFFPQLLLTLLLTSSVLAQVEGQLPLQPPNFVVRLMQLLPMIALLFLVFYFMVFRPQNEKERKHQELLAELKKGNQLVTSGGLIGRVAVIEKDYILLEVDSGTKLKVLKTNIVRLYEGAAKE